MTNSKYLYLLLILSFAVALFTGLRHIGWSTVDTNSATAPSSAGIIDTAPGLSGAAFAQGTAPISVTHTAPVTAVPEQQLPPPPISQPGGTFVQVVAQDADTLNPLLTTNSTSLAVLQKIYPVLVDQSPTSGLPTVGRGLATDWKFAEDGRTITFTLRSGVFWSDGAPVTAQDVKFTYEAILDPTVKNAYRDNFATINNIQIGESAGESKQQTVVLQLASADCAILQALNQPILPSHLYGSFTAVQLADVDLRPKVSAGPFLLIDWIPDHRITLVRNAAYWEGAPRLERWELHIIPDPLAQLQALLSGNADWLQLDPTQISQVQTVPNLTLYGTLADSLTFVALNLADSVNPQAGRTAEGALNPQMPHPILGDRRVRQALATAVDYAQLLAEVYGNSGQRLGGYVLPTVEWAYASELQPIDYDLAEAQRLLAEAGWLDSDGDGVRERAGIPLQLSLLTNADSSQRAQLGALLVHQWRQLGIDVRFEALLFDTVADSLLAQRFDMVLIGWDNLGAEPANSDFWHSRYDAPGNGANFVSYQNSDVDRWLDEALMAPACDPARRGNLYRAVQQQIYEDLPYIFLSGHMKTWAYPSSWQGIQPAPWRFDYNTHQWWQHD